MRACAILVLFVAGAARAADKPKPLKPIFAAAKGIPVVMPKDGVKDSPFEIKSADELAKSPLFGPGGADKLKKEVDFDREKLVIFAWVGSRYAGVTGELAADGKAATYTWHYGSAKRPDEGRKNFVIFVVPKAAATKVEVDSRVPK